MEGQTGTASHRCNKILVGLQFAFLEVVVPMKDGADRLIVRVGRFGMSLGSGRLVATRAAPNIPFKFDGVETIYSQPQWSMTCFATEPVKDSGHLDGENHSIKFWGVYLTHWLDNTKKTGLDFYYLGIREPSTLDSGTAVQTRHSLGARQFGEWEHWDWNSEEVIQFGSFGNESILA